MAFIAHAAKGVRRSTGRNGLNQFGRSSTHVVHLYALAAGHAHQKQLVVRRAKHVGGQRASRNAPLDGLADQINGDQFVAFLHADIGGAAFAVNPNMAGRFAGGNALGQGGLFAVPAVQVHMVEPVAHNHQPLHVGREAQVVRIQNAAQGALHDSGFGVHKRERVAQGVGDDEGFFVGRQVQVVRLFAGMKALGLFPGDGVNHTDAGALRIQHKNRWRLSGNGPKRHHTQDGSQESVQTVHKYPNSQILCFLGTR